MNGMITVENRKAAFAKIAELTEGLRTFSGTGNAHYEPYAQVCWESNWTAWVTLRPEGDLGPSFRTIVKCLQF